MVVRTTLSSTARHAQMTLSRATVREFDDKHLMQQVKYADVHHSETPSDFERWQMVGLTAMPLKQAKDQQQGGQQQQANGGGGGGGGLGGVSNPGAQSEGEQGDWNHNQPKGEAAEAVMLYLGSRSHPVAIVDDRRVRPYALNEGETALYAASGTGQMLFHNDDGSHLVATNNPPEQSEDNKDKERYASLRHVKKKKQSRQIKEGQQIDDPKHAGETINSEVRCTSGRIEFRVGDAVVGYYDAKAKRWSLIGDVVRLGDDNANNPVLGDTGTVSKTSSKVFVTAPNDAHPTSLDKQT